MRLLFINYEFPPLGGGGSNANLHLFHEFSSLTGIEIDCITSSAGSGLEVVQFAPNIRLYRLPVGKRELHYWRQTEIIRWLAGAIRFVRHLTKINRYDLCHAFFGFPSGLIPYLNRSRFPYLVSLRGSDVPGFNPRLSLQYRILAPLFRAIWQAAEAVIANSDGLKRLAGESWCGSVGVIPNGVDTEQFSPAVGRQRGTQILCVSRLVGRKGVQFLIEAMPEICRVVSGATLTLVGSGKEEANLRELAGRLGIEQHVQFLGAVEHRDLPEIYRRADLYVQPSFYEGMSNTILEAMACGLPIVSTAEGGVEELLKGNAERPPYGDAKALAVIIGGLLQHPERCAEMGLESRTIAQRFSWKAVADAYLDEYRKILGRKA